MNLIISSLVFVAAFSCTGFLFSRILKRNDIADVFWGIGFLVLGWFHALSNPEPLGVHQKVTLALVSAWAIRLSLYIGLRNRWKPEDPRYANWRREWGTREPLRTFGQVFVLQALLLCVIALPLMRIVGSESVALSPWDFAGLGLSIFGLAFETGADLQVSAFKKDPANRGKILTSGLWSYCRHPNYFGEIVFWWGIFLLSLSLTGAHWGLVSPILITYLLSRVSGVPMLEAMMKKRGPDFEHYVMTTPSLVPLRPRTVLRTIVLLVTTLMLDLFWLGFLFRDFYVQQTASIARIKDGAFDAVIWAAAGVYVAIPLGVGVLACVPGDRGQSLFRGALLGLIMYLVYDLTNLSLLTVWPTDMAWVDILWGSILCGTSSWAGSWVPHASNMEQRRPG